MVNLQVYRGEDQTITFTITEPDGSTAILLDSRGATVYFVVSNTLPQTTATGGKLINKNSTDGNNSGVVSFTLDNSDTDLEPKLYYYEVYVVFEDGDIYSAEVGRFWVRRRGVQ